MKVTLLLVAYGLAFSSLPPLQGRSGVKYGRAVFNSSLKRHEIWIGLEELQKNHRDIFNNLRRPGAQWIVADVRIDFDENSIFEDLEKTKAELADLKVVHERLQKDFDGLLEKVTASMPAPGQRAEETKPEQTEQKPEGEGGLSAFRALRQAAKDKCARLNLEFPANPNKEKLEEIMALPEGENPPADPPTGEPPKGEPPTEQPPQE